MPALAELSRALQRFFTVGSTKRVSKIKAACEFPGRISKRPYIEACRRAIIVLVALVCYKALSMEDWMSTTTIRIPEALKARVALAAERAGTSAHSFILEAITEKAARAERRADFFEVAENRYAELTDTGETIPWKTMRAYLETRVAGKAAARPLAKKLAP